MLRHASRARAAEKVFGVKVVGIGSRQMDPKVRAARTRYWSAACRRGHPEECNGFRRVKWEGLKPCECPIHANVTKVTVEILQA